MPVEGQIGRLQEQSPEELGVQRAFDADARVFRLGRHRVRQEEDKQPEDGLSEGV